MTEPTTQTADYPAIEQVTKSHVPTEQAAHYLSRKPQTLREWASTERGALRPLRIHGRLAWPVADIKRVLGLAE